jgi:hypothetical protein
MTYEYGYAMGIADYHEAADELLILALWQFSTNDDARRARWPSVIRPR